MARTQQRLKRYVGKQSWTDNGRLVFDLPRDYDLESIVIRVAGTSTLSVAGSAVRAEAPLQALKFINLKANGTDVLDGVSGVMAHRLGAFRRGQLPPVTAPSDATAAARTFAGVVVLDRAVIDGIRPKDAAFPARGLSTLQLELTMGAAIDLFTGTPTGVISAATVEVSVVQIAEQAGADGKRSLPRVVTKRTQMTIPFAATNANFQQRLNTGNLTRGLVIRAYGATTAGEPSDTGLNNVKIQQGNQVFLDLPYSTLRALNATELDITTLPTGYVFVDFMNLGGPAGKLSDCLDMRGGEELYAYFDVTGATNQALDIVTMEYMPYNPKYWGINA
jgi:hypothetical protein